MRLQGQDNRDGIRAAVARRKEIEEFDAIRQEWLFAELEKEKPKEVVEHRPEG